VNKDYKPFFTQTTCPLCHHTLILAWQPYTIPFFGEVIFTCTQCECGFKYADTMILSQREPARYTMKVKSPGDLDVRVIRSTSGTIRIPELEIDIEPGPASESYVSNLEGVLHRIENVLRMVSTWEDETPTAIERAYELLEALDQVRKGEREITIIIEDPLGNSAIISERAICENVSLEEAKALKTGMIVLENDDVPDHLQ
jgi:zinc finger protein